MKDFYYILGTNSNCSPIEITEAYNKLAQKLQPVNGENDYFLEEHLREISEAHQILSDPAKRSRYDVALKRLHKKQLANFKTKHINIALTSALILFTGVFGFYVVKSLNTTHAVVTPTVKVADVPVVIPHKIKHHKKKQHTIAEATPLVAAKPVVVPKPAVVAKDTMPKQIAVQIKQIAKVAPVVAAPKPPPVIVKTIPTKVDSSYTAYLKPNLTGDVYLHQLADYMSPVLTVLPLHSKVRVLENNQGFYKVAFNNQVGYIPKSTIVRQ